MAELTEQEIISRAMSILGSRGGRPRGHKLTAEQKARLRVAQQKRRERERAEAEQVQKAS